MEPALFMHKVVRNYPGFRLGPLDITLEPGRVLGYIGPNGSGKSTTMHCITGLLKRESGDIRIFGRANDLCHPEWKQNIGYVGDAQSFYERWTVEQNFSFFARFYTNWSSNLAKRLAKRFRLPLDKRAKELSGGNRVKLALVAALAYSPALLILDEPTVGLDPVVRSEVLETLFEILSDGERAIFYSTHILSDISRLADELAFLQDGRLQRRELTADLVQNWRRITFQLKKLTEPLPGIIVQEQENEAFRLVSANASETVKKLLELRAENITQTRMALEEIAVFILKSNDSNQH